MLHLINIYKVIFLLLTKDNGGQKQMAKLKQAIYWMRNGGKVTRPHWEAHSYLEIIPSVTERIIYSDGTNAVFHLKQLEATDWMLWKEEEKDLSISNAKVRRLLRLLNQFPKSDLSVNALISYLEQD